MTAKRKKAAPQTPAPAPRPKPKPKPKPKPAPAPEPSPWAKFDPDEPRYWHHGGPWVPPEAIEAESTLSTQPGSLYPHEKPAQRLERVMFLLAAKERDLAESTTYYVALHERGAEAFPQAWMVGSYRSDREHYPNQPNELDKQRAECVKKIAVAKATIPSCRAVLAILDAAVAPLFHQATDES